MSSPKDFLFSSSDQLIQQVWTTMLYESIQQEHNNKALHFTQSNSHKDLALNKEEMIERVKDLEKSDSLSIMRRVTTALSNDNAAIRSPNFLEPPVAINVKEFSPVLNITNQFNASTGIKLSTFFFFHLES